MFNQNEDTLELLWSMVRHGIKGDFASFLLSTGNGIWPFRITAIVICYICSSLFYRILLKHPQITNTQAKTAFALALLYPLPATKTALSIVPFLFPLIFFFAAFYLSLINKFENKFYGKFIIIALFTISFSTNSLLLFYYSFILYKYTKNYKNFNFICIKLFIKKYWYYILLPILFYLYKIIFISPWGLYYGYNSVNFKNIFKLPILFLDSFNVAVFGIMNGEPIFYYFIILIIIIYIIFACIIKKINKKTIISINKKNLYIFISSALIIFFAITPYLMVDKIPVSQGWNSRFLILAPYGVGLFWASFIELFQSNNKSLKNLKKLLVAAIMVCFTLISYNKYREYLIDWYFDLAVIDIFSSNSDIQKENTFIIKEYSDGVDITVNKNYYEWTGILRRIFNQETRLMIPRYGSDEVSIDPYCGNIYRQYNYIDWPCSKKFVAFNLKYSRAEANKNFPHLIFLYYFDRANFSKEIGRYVYLEKN